MNEMETEGKHTDDESFKLLKKRDRAFLASLFRDVNPYLNRVCRANGFGQNDTKDLIHQTWEKFFSNF